MEISGFGLVNFEDYRLSSSRAINGSQNSFEDILRKIQKSENSDLLSGGQRPGASDIDKNDRLYELCLELETFLVKNLLTGMRNTVQKSGIIEEGFAGKMYEDMLWDEYSKDFTKNAGFGLAEQAYRQLKTL